ncbi:MAG: NAD(P)-dependent oxidoreductase [Clostridiales bacterium]|jgi:nucleoside-diphosphate-sugar epimerase|nr:NAD(P)-dependent oxidoreductase [Clostridiales bacterium]
MTHAIVTGASGFIGFYLTRRLLASGIQVTALCREKSRNINRLPGQVNIIYDLNDLPKADIFYHLAWGGASGPGRADPNKQIKNVGLTIKALEKSYQIGCKRFIALGTIYEKLAHQIKASKKFSGPDFYVLSKEYAHNMACQLSNKLGAEFIWCTICHPIGGLMKPEQLMASVISSLLLGKSPQLGPALSSYDIVAVEDIALGLYLLGETKSLFHDEYYIGSGAPKALYKWLEEARNILGVETPLGIGRRPDDGLMFEEGWFDISLIQEDTGYLPEVDFSEAVSNVAKSINAYGGA